MQGYREKSLRNNGSWKIMVLTGDIPYCLYVVPVKMSVHFLLLTEKKYSSAHLRRVVLLQGVCFVLIVSCKYSVCSSEK